jgi:hypothetical protein
MDTNGLKQAIETLQTGDLYAKIQAARDLGNASGDDKFDISDAADALIDCLTGGEDEALRASSVMALYNSTDSGTDFSGKVNALKPALSDPFFGVRFYSIPLFAVLADKGADLTPALPEMTNQMAAENDSQCRTNLALAFFNMADHGADIGDAVPVLVTALAIPDLSSIFYLNASDAVIAFARNHPEQKEIVRVILENSPLSPDDENRKKIEAAVSGPA